MNGDVVCAECEQTVPHESTIQHGETVICAECKPLFMQRLREGAVLPPAAQKYAYAGFWIRCAAVILDQIIVLAVTFPILIAVYGSGYYLGSGSGLIEGYIDLLVSWILPPVATIAFWVWKQATPAKMLLGLKIVDAATGECPTIRQFIVRYLMYYVAALPLGAGYLAVAFDSKKQGWHDRTARTVVIRTRRPVREPRPQTGGTGKLMNFS